MTELTAASPLARHSGAAAVLSTAHRAFGFALVKKQADWSPLSVLFVVLFLNIQTRATLPLLCMSSWHKRAAKPLNYTQDKDRQVPQNCFSLSPQKKPFVSCSSCLWDQQSIASSTPRAGLTKRCCWFCLLSWSNTIWFGLRKGGSSAWCWSLKDSEDKSVRDSAPGMACSTEEEVTSLLLHWSTTKKTSFQVGPFQSSDRKLNDPVGSTATLSAFLYEWDGHWGGLSW